MFENSRNGHPPNFKILDEKSGIFYYTLNWLKLIHLRPTL